MLELPILAVFATCIFGMIKTSSKKRVKLPIWERENGKQEIEVWLTGFLAKLRRNSTRTQKCRLISSVERVNFEYDWKAYWWQYVQFGDEEAEIFENDKSLEKLKLTEFQKMILKSDSSLKNRLLSRSKIKSEIGKWNIPAELDNRKISEGGEALIFSERFGDLETAVRVQIFDPFLFTKDFGIDSLSWKIHFQKDFEKAVDRFGKQNQVPKHENVIANFVNVELFHKEDSKQEDCLGWITIMEKGGEDLRKILKEEKIEIVERKKIAEGIWKGWRYLAKIGIQHYDLKMENILLVGGIPKIIDFGLVWERTERSGYREMGYTRKGSKFRYYSALFAATPGFANQWQFTSGAGYYVQNLYYFLFCDWKTGWTLLCANGMHKCHVNAVCADTFQAYTCSCKAGFTGNGFACSDVNECQVSSPCPADSDCTNTVGAYICSCKTGFQGSAGACQDENECANGRHTCDSASMCTNTIGSFKCACDNGFEDDGSGCVDINECAKQACHPDATCTNLVGSYECACKDGFKGNGMLCMNIDECATGVHSCAASEKCEDTKGSFNCVGVKCPPIGTFDLALLLDTNVDIGDAGLAATKDFAKEMIDSFEVGASSAKITVAGYSGEKVAPSVFLLDSATSPKPTLLSKVDSINFSGRDLRIERALAFLVNFSFLEAMGRRPDKPGIAILTASKKTYSASALDAVVRRIRTDKSTRYITIGVGEASKTEMASVSGNPQYVFEIASYDELPSLMPKIMDLICEIDAEFNQ